jgi:hypothetical protein
MRVMLELEVKLIELPDDDPEPATAVVGGEDPMAELAHMAGHVVKMVSPNTIFPMSRRPGGLEFRRSAVLGCGTFPTLVEILDKYQELTAKLEKAWP